MRNVKVLNVTGGVSSKMDQAVRHDEGVETKENLTELN